MSHSSAPGGHWGHRAAPALSHLWRYFIPKAHGWMAEQLLGKGKCLLMLSHTHTADMCTPSPALLTQCDNLLLAPHSLQSPSEDKGQPRPKQPMHSKAPFFLVLLNSTRALPTFQIGSESCWASFRNLWHPGWMPDPKTQILCRNQRREGPTRLPAPHTVIPPPHIGDPHPFTEQECLLPCHGPKGWVGVGLGDHSHLLQCE